MYGAGDAHLMADIQQPDGIGAVNLNLDDMLRMYRVSDGPGGGVGGGAAAMMQPGAAMQMDATGGAPLPPPPVQLSAAARALIGEDAAVGLAAAGTRPVERGFALDEKMRATDVDGFLQVTFTEFFVYFLFTRNRPHYYKDTPVVERKGERTLHHMRPLNTSLSLCSFLHPALTHRSPFHKFPIHVMNLPILTHKNSPSYLFLLPVSIPHRHHHTSTTTTAWCSRR